MLVYLIFFFFSVVESVVELYNPTSVRSSFRITPSRETGTIRDQSENEDFLFLPTNGVIPPEVSTCIFCVLSLLSFLFFFFLQVEITTIFVVFVF